MRQRFSASYPAACLSGVIFLFNGFLLYRMVAGERAYYVIGLVPFLCDSLLAPVS